ncbi:MAG: DNA polymerase III subunit alpha [Ignavibacteriae bacterium]|nr:MAG: DNA polymerase III subunit alpha [Ignavibacteriota bacterium]
MSDFVHLHNHSHYSLQDAACTIDSLINATQKNNMHAIALTDHGVMYGISEFYKKAKKANIKPIIGVEIYIKFEGSRFERGEKNTGRKKSRHYNHLILIAKNNIGYKNLLKLTTQGFTEGFYYKPRIDLELLNQHKEGLICTSACLAGPVASHLLNGDYEKAKENTIILHEMFGEDFFLELQDHSMSEDQAVLEGIPKLSKELNIPMICTNDIHYIEKEHAVAHNILLMLSDPNQKNDYRTLRYNTDEIYFKSGQQMKDLFGKFNGAIENTLAIEEKIDLSLDFEKFHYPIFPIPKESSAKNLDEYFELLSREGLDKRFKTINKNIEDRFNYEIDIIKSMGYSGYFLITQDFINAAKKRGIPVGPGRGSAAGSLVAYALGITNVNPLEYDLLFERFLNPSRKSMPDIDIDFADDQRGEVIDYVKEKYGEQSVCQIITFNRLSSKAVLRDVARVLGIPIPTVDKITKVIPSKFGRVFSIEQSLKEVPELAWVKNSKDESILNLIKYAKILEGMNRNASKHAAGVVITPGEVSDFIPIASVKGDIVTQYNMKELDSAGILKMDFLGLRTLTIIRDTIDLIKETRDEDVIIDDIPIDDKKTYELFSKGQTTGVFQFESAPMKEHLKNLKPTSIKDLSAMNALYRPGPMEFINDFVDRKHGRKPIEYLHPLLEEILSETYGIIVYQEQVIQIANKIAGMSLAEADILRRAMGKKDLAEMKRQKTKFVDGAVENDIPKKIAEEIFVVIDKFANYGFNKSHAVAYSFVAYQTAYLKANYTAEFLAANLSNEYKNSDKVTILLDDCRKLKIPVMVPSVNNPSVKFTVKDGKIIFGMSAIKNVGVNVVVEIERAYKELGRNFTSIYDFTSNVDTYIVNKRAMEGLVLSGAFDSVKGTRAENFISIEKALQFGQKSKQIKESQSDSLFGEIDEHFELDEPELETIEEWTNKYKLAQERIALGFYLSDHPLRKFQAEYNSFSSVKLGDPHSFKDTDTVRACGVITSVKTKIDRSGNTMAFFNLDDLSGSCECIMFGRTYSEFGKIIEPEATVMIEGKLESSGDKFKIHANEATALSEVAGKLTKKIALLMDVEEHDGNTVKQLKKIFNENSGSLPVIIYVKVEGKTKKYIIGQKVNINNNFIKETQKIIGDEAIAYQTF